METSVLLFYFTLHLGLSKSIKIGVLTCFDFDVTRNIEFCLYYQFQQIAMDLCLPLLNFPKKRPARWGTNPPRSITIMAGPRAMVSRSSEARSYEQRLTFSPAIHLIDASTVTLYYEEGHQFGWEYIILWKYKNKISEIGWKQVMLNSRQYKQSNATLRKQANITALLSSISYISFYFSGHVCVCNLF